MFHKPFLMSINLYGPSFSCKCTLNLIYSSAGERAVYFGRPPWKLVIKLSLDHIFYRAQAENKNTRGLQDVFSTAVLQLTLRLSHIGFIFGGFLT